jgi:GNAT superfamily N-acetyltransferase
MLTVMIRSGSNSLVVRPLAPVDADRVRALFLAGMRSMKPLLPNDVAHTDLEGYLGKVLATDMADPFKHYIASGNRSGFWVADLNSEVVGTVGIYPQVSEPDIAEVFRVSVDERHRKLGIAGQLMDKAESWSVEQGFSELMLHTTEYLPAAHRLYENRGYSLAKRLQFGQIQGREYRKLLV